MKAVVRRYIIEIVLDGQPGPIALEMHCGRIVLQDWRWGSQFSVPTGGERAQIPF
ncbi:hypothetical protein T02_13717 [Trichinella nativa]|uniref:Uncharacterized protein n=1 Tax=Trichinella nativa TaxID=6335 RepID=A0A0V1KJ50_9BILA|nr:hypothetical protein T02_13717 [Trichinella nativa]